MSNSYRPRPALTVWAREQKETSRHLLRCGWLFIFIRQKWNIYLVSVVAFFFKTKKCYKLCVCSGDVSMPNNCILQFWGKKKKQKNINIWRLIRKSINYTACSEIPMLRIGSNNKKHPPGQRNGSLDQAYLHLTRLIRSDLPPPNSLNSTSVLLNPFVGFIADSGVSEWCEGATIDHH